MTFNLDKRNALGVKILSREYVSEYNSVMWRSPNTAIESLLCVSHTDASASTTTILLYLHWASLADCAELSSSTLSIHRGMINYEADKHKDDYSHPRVSLETKALQVCWGRHLCLTNHRDYVILTADESPNYTPYITDINQWTNSKLS